MSMNKFMIHNDGRTGRPQMMGNPYGGGQMGNSFPSSTASHIYAPNTNPSGKFAIKFDFMGLNYVSPSIVHYRSAAEASLDSSSKFRQLPCKTLIAVGTCPYGERCVFLHDPRLICHSAHSISRLKNKEDNVVDSFFWPLASNDSTTVHDKKANHNFRPYNIPPPKGDQFRNHDQALYSIWMHYVEFCRFTAKEAKSFGNAPKLAPQDTPVNVFTGTQRLPVFQLLSSSEGCPISREQFHLATHGESPSYHLLNFILTSYFTVDRHNVRSSPDALLQQQQQLSAAPQRQMSAVVQQIPIKVVAGNGQLRTVSPTSVNARNVFSPDERFPEMMSSLSKQNSKEKMMLNGLGRMRAHSGGELSSGFPSYASECDDLSVEDHEEWNAQHQLLVGGFDETASHSWL